MPNYIKPERAKELAAIFSKASRRTAKEMPWLYGMHLTPDDMEKIEGLLVGINMDLEHGAWCENAFFENARKSSESIFDLVCLVIDKKKQQQEQEHHVRR